MLERDELRKVGLDAGLTAVGFTTADPFAKTRAVLEDRKARGLHATMQFTYRNPERSTTPTRILADARTLIVGAWPYAAPRSGPAQPVELAAGEPVSGEPRATIASYAWRDHYSDLRDALDAMGERLRSDGWVARVVADDNALVDRAAAVRAGIGWSGKNSNVLVPGAGSWFVLGAVVTNAEFEPDKAVDSACGSCVRCIDHCPTDAIVAPGVVDARRCLAWLLQAEGDFPLEYREALGTRIYGCDDCQTVCPPGRNHQAALHGDEVTTLNLFDLLRADDEQLMAAVGRWYIPRRDPDYVRRNALIALGNSRLSESDRDSGGDRDSESNRDSESERDSESDREIARRLLDDYDNRSPMLARHSAWARAQLGLIR